MLNFNTVIFCTTQVGPNGIKTRMFPNFDILRMGGIRIFLGLRSVCLGVWGLVVGPRLVVLPSVVAAPYIDKLINIWPVGWTNSTYIITCCYHWGLWWIVVNIIPIA